MSSFVFSIFLFISWCSANALSPMYEPQVLSNTVDPFMLGVCEGIASMSMIVTEMQLNRAEKNVMIFSITTEEKIRQDFYCFHCEGAKPEDEIIVLSSLNDEKLACEGHQ